MTKAVHLASDLNGIAMDKILIRDFLSGAIEASKKAYAPYSNFPVGCLIALKNGERFSGANIENASYPVSICAERTALSQIVLRGLHDEIAMVVVVTKAEKPGTPCGMCRQFMSEFLMPDTPIVYGNMKGQYEISSMQQLLPLAFDKSALVK